MIGGRGFTDEIIIPGIGIQRRIAEQIKRRTVVVIRAGFGGKTFDAPRSSSELRGKGRGEYLEFTQRLDRWRSLVESGTAVGARGTDTVQQNLGAEVLAPA